MNQEIIFNVLINIKNSSTFCLLLSHWVKYIWPDSIANCLFKDVLKYPFPPRVHKIAAQVEDGKRHLA